MKRFLIAAAATTALIVLSAPAKADMATVFAGVSVKEDSFFGYGGGVAALNGDLSKNGFLARALFGGGSYEYTSGGVNVDGRVLQFDAMAGYQFFLKPIRVSAYVGVDHQDHKTSPNDPLNATLGGETGFKVQGEVETTGSPFYLSGMGSYSTANDTYWMRGRAGVDAWMFTVGPEIIYDGNEEYDSERYGAFISVGLGVAEVSASLGWADTQGLLGEDSLYGTVGVSTSF